MKRVYSGVVAAGLCLSMMGSFTGCGEVKVYKTMHEFSDLNISSFAIKKLFFEDKCSPEKIGRKISDFCIYEYEDEYENGYKAIGDIHITINNEYIVNGVMNIYFNADKEFEYWDLKNFSFDEIEESDKSLFRKPYDFLMDEFGEPTSESTSYGDNLDYSWETDEYRIIYQYCEIFYPSYKKYNYIRYWDVSDEND